MKFLCDNCKAKYQIADDKVAGKTVRMKCRKCGHQIEVRAAVTETSVASPAPRAQTGAPPRPPSRSGLATSLSATKPRAPAPSTRPGGATAGALAGAFKSNVQDASASTDGDTQSASIELSVSDEWYVAINGVPVGPVRISELRRKAATGAVTEESLCWQEGLEEWRPIRSIPDLAAIVREAAQGNRPSLTGSHADAPPLPGRALAPASVQSHALEPLAPSAPLAASAPLPAASSRAGAPLAPAAPATGRSNVVPLRPSAAQANAQQNQVSGLDDIHSSGGAAVARAAALTPAPASARAAPLHSTPAPAPLATPAPVVTADPFAAAPAQASPFAVDPFAAPASAALGATDAAAMPPVSPGPQGQRQGVPLWFWPVLVLALAFGATFAVLLFRSQPPAPQVVVQVPTATATIAAPDKGDIPPPAPSAEASAAASADTKGKTGPVVAKAQTARPADVPEKKGLDLGGLVPGGGGPNVGPNSAPAGGSGSGLDAAGVERVVAVHRNGVKRTCWERGGSDQKSSVNVTITASVAPNGSVASTSSSGDDPVVAKCIEGQVKSWQFPAPGATTTLNIPFKFVRQ